MSKMKISRAGILLHLLILTGSLAQANNDNDNHNNRNSSNDDDDQATDELLFHFESDIKISSVISSRLSVTKFSQRSVNVARFSRHCLFNVRLPGDAYVNDFQVSLKRRTSKSRLVDRMLTRRFKTSSITHLIQSSTRNCNEFNFRLKVGSGEQIEMTLTYEHLLRRSEGRYTAELYGDLCTDDFKDGEEGDRRLTPRHDNRRFRHHKIGQLKADVVVKETSAILNPMTHPRDESSAEVQSIIAGLSDLMPRSVSVGDNTGKIPVTLRRRRPNEVHYQFLYKEKYQEFYDDGHSTSTSPPPTSSSSSSSSSLSPHSSSEEKPLNWFIPRDIKLTYDVRRDNLGEIQTRGSHFLYFFAPTEEKFRALVKDVVILFDAPPSQLGRVNSALKELLAGQLDEKDKFNILCFEPSPYGSDKVIRRIAIGMAGASANNIKTTSILLDEFAALNSRLENPRPRPEGAFYADLREGLLQSLDLLNKQKEADPYDTRLSLLFHLTSSSSFSTSSSSSSSSSFSNPEMMKTSALSDVERERILLSLEKRNRANAVIVSAVLRSDGASPFDRSHVHFLELLSRQSNGSVLLQPLDEDAESFVLRVFRSASKVLLKDLSFKVVGYKPSRNASASVRLVPEHYPLFPAGRELIVAGHLRNDIDRNDRQQLQQQQQQQQRRMITKCKLSVSGINNHGFVSFDSSFLFYRKSRDHDYHGDEFDDEFADEDLRQIGARLKRINQLERVGAHLQLEQLRNMAYLRRGRKDEEETKKLRIAYRELAAQYNLLAPGKCLLLDKALGRDAAICAIDEDDLPDAGAKSSPTSDEPLKTFADNDPHFVVRVDGLTEHVCFDVLGRAGKVIQLLHDRSRDVTVNSLIVETNNGTDNGTDNHTYLGRISFITSELRCLVVDRRWISLNGTRYAWTRNDTVELPGSLPDTKVFLATRRLVRIEHGKLTFRILKHQTPARFQFLGFYVDNGSELSQRAGGLIALDVYRAFLRMNTRFKRTDKYTNALKAMVEDFQERERMSVIMSQFYNMMASLERTSLKVKHSQAEQSISLRGRLTFKRPGSPDTTAQSHLSYRRDMESGQRMPCWHVGNEGRDAAGSLERFLVPSLCHRGPASRPPA